MSAELERLHRDIREIKTEIRFIRNILREDFELSDRAKKALRKARKTKKSEYIDLKELD